MAEVNKVMTAPAVESSEKSRDRPGFEEVENLEEFAGHVCSYDEDVEPQLHYRTWIAVVAFFLLNFVQIVAMQSPAAVVGLLPKTM